MTRVVLAATACLALAGCHAAKFDPSTGAPPPAQVIESNNADVVTVDHPGRFPLVAAGAIDEPDQLRVTGAVFPDVNREVPVISLASGRVVDIRATLDQNVTQGQLLLSVQSPDITAAFDAYLKAVNDERLARQALQRTRDLFDHGAAPQSAVEQTEDAEADAQADLNAANQQLQTLGVNKDHPSDIVNVYAPISGVVVAQNVTNSAAAGVTYTGSPSVFTIADLSHVWVICDVYENDLPQVHLGQAASIAVTGYPGRTLTGVVSDIGPVLDPTLRTAKVRVEVANSGILRLGMFVTATLTSRTRQRRASVPASAILHLHDQDWVFVPQGSSGFRRIAVQPGDLLPGDRQVILSGVAPGQPVVRSVLQLEAQLEAQ